MLRRLVTFIFSLCLLGGAALTARADAGKPFDLQGFIDQAVRAGQKRIVIPPGRHRVTPHQAQHLVLRGLEGIEIIADGAELICTETTRAITIVQCRNLTLRGLTIDYDPLPFTQGRIVKLSADKRVHEIELFEGYPEAGTVRPFKYEIFRPDTRTLRCEDHAMKEIETIDARHFRLTTTARADDPVQVGDIIAIGTQIAPHGNAGHAVTLEDCVHVRLEKITLYASNCFGFLETGCDGTTYDHCCIDRRAAETDLVQRADPRIRSLDADAYHSKHALKGPALIGCVAKFMGDDAVNICGDYHMIMACQGTRLRVLAKGKMNIAPGDPVELMAYDGTRPPDAKAVAVAPDGKISDEERAFLLKQRMDERSRTRENIRAYTVTLDREVGLPMGSLIGSTNRMGNGFTVQGCDFGANRSRGILIKASDGKVIGNTLAGSWGEAIKVSPEYWWLESGSSNNVEIRDNAISDCRAMGIAVYANGGPGTISPAGAHRNITIVNNTVTETPSPNIYVTSTDKVRIEGNKLSKTTGPRRPSRQRRTEKAEPITTINCTGVTMENNKVE